MNLLTLQRVEYGEQGTQGTLTLPDGWDCRTIELPWRANAVGESCVPEGVYRMKMRRSGVVERTSGGQFLRGWEITGVPGRTYIMIHVGNTIRDLAGCVAVGGIRGEHRGLPAVLGSHKTFTQFMRRIDPRNDYDIDIRSNNPPEWP